MLIDVFVFLHIVNDVFASCILHVHVYALKRHCSKQQGHKRSLFCCYLDVFSKCIVEIF